MLGQVCCHPTEEAAEQRHRDGVVEGGVGSRVPTEVLHEAATEVAPPVVEVGEDRTPDQRGHKYPAFSRRHLCYLLCRSSNHRVSTSPDNPRTRESPSPPKAVSPA